MTGHCVWDMDAAERTMTWAVTGTEGTAVRLRSVTRTSDQMEHIFLNVPLGCLTHLRSVGYS
jgi:hypothetical protein